MAFLEFKNVQVVGISAGVPQNVADNLHPSADDDVSSDYAPEDFVKTTGVKERRVSSTLTTSDLCYAAAEKLISDLAWRKEEIEGIIFVSQTPDYILPATACILQDRLGLSKDCYAADVSLGCSGWVYGLSIAASLVSSGSIRKVLLMCGDAAGRFDWEKHHRNPLFGSAASVTALEFNKDAPSIYFHVGTDGSGFDAIITPDGGSRNPITMSGFKPDLIDGKESYRLMARMKGMDVFSFGISIAPKSVRRLAEHFGFDYLEADWFVFHQANMKMNDMIIKKLKLDPQRVPSSMYRFGNTNGASIPMTIVSELKEKVEKTPTFFICCSFGVGLSWATTAFRTDSLLISDLVEVPDDETDKTHIV